MTLIFCLEKKGGMMFFGKRHSTDAKLREWIISRTKGSKLWMSSYSAKQFGETDCITVDDDYPYKAQSGDYCFVEDKPYSLGKVTQIILCKWNRAYPSDTFFEIDLKSEKFKRVSREDIVGSSHEKITLETYRRG